MVGFGRSPELPGSASPRSAGASSNWRPEENRCWRAGFADRAAAARPLRSWILS